MVMQNVGEGGNKVHDMMGDVQVAYEPSFWLFLMRSFSYLQESAFYTKVQLKQWSLPLIMFLLLHLRAKWS